jgi:hypothetical protein
MPRMAVGVCGEALAPLVQEQRHRHVEEGEVSEMECSYVPCGHELARPHRQPLRPPSHAQTCPSWPRSIGHSRCRQAR